MSLYPQKALSSTFYGTVTFDSDLLTPKLDVFFYHIMHYSCKSGKNLSSNFQEQAQKCFFPAQFMLTF